MTEACRLAKESVDNNWGGPFGAVIVQDGEIIARGQNRVLLTGDITAHAEIETIRKAVAFLNPQAPSIATEHLNESTLELVPRPAGSPDPVPAGEDAHGNADLHQRRAVPDVHERESTGRGIDAVYFANDLEETRRIGFDDAFQYEDFAKPMSERRIKIEQFRPDLGDAPTRRGMTNPDQHPY